MASKFLKLMDGVKKYIETAETSEKPSLPSWKNLVTGFKDNFLRAKICFFVSVAKEVEPFLRRFQTIKPMAPLLYEATATVLKQLFKRDEE